MRNEHFVKRSLLPFIMIIVAVALSISAAESQGNQSKDQQRVAATQVDLRPSFTKWGLGIKWQARRDTCAVFTATAALEYALAKRLNRGVRLSEEYLNWAANRATNQLQDGASLAELVQGFDLWGICNEQYMPYYSLFNPMYQPSEAALQSAREVWGLGFTYHWLETGRAAGLTDAHLESIKKVLRTGWPVCAGGEHNMLLIGYSDDRRQAGGGLFLARNSATRKYETVTYAAAKPKFHSLLWIELPPAEKEPKSTKPTDQS